MIDTRSDATAERPAPSPGPAQFRTPDTRTQRVRRLLIQSLGIGSFYVVVLVFFAIRIPNFFALDNISGVLSTSAALGLVAIGQTYAIVSGGFDISVGGIVPLAAVVFAATANATGSLPLAMVTAIAVGAIVGVLNALIIARFKINPLIATLGMLSVAGGFAFVATDGVTVILSDPSAGVFGDRIAGGLQFAVITFLAVALIAALVLRFTSYGRSIYAVGGNAEAAELAGVRVRLVSASVYVISGVCSALAGIVLSSQLLAASPTIGTDTTLNSVAAVILGGAALSGGIGGVSGTVLGVLLLGTVANGLALMQVSSFYQTIATGCILLLAVSFARLREVLTKGRSSGSSRAARAAAAASVESGPRT